MSGFLTPGKTPICLVQEGFFPIHHARGEVRRRLGLVCTRSMLHAGVSCQAAFAEAVSPSCSLGAPLVREGIEITDDQKWA